MSLRKTARIGMVNFINTAPIYEVWQRRVQRPDWHIIEAPPSELNHMLCSGELDLGFISSHEYAVHPHNYRILPGLSISASGPVGSVFLFSRIPLKDLSGEEVLLSDQSQTSVSLVKIILEVFYNVRPGYVIGKVADAGIFGQPAVLAIGDDALRLNQAGSYTYRIDLGEIWQHYTGLPFVFSVCAVREEFYLEQRQQLMDIHTELLDCLAEGRRTLWEICSLVAPRIPMSVEACYGYLKAIEHDLGPEKLKALEAFFGYVIDRGEGDAGALPLRMAEE